MKLTLRLQQYKRILRYVDLEERGYGNRTTIWRKVKAGKIPPPRDFMDRPGWLPEELEEFENSRPVLTQSAA